MGNLRVGSRIGDYVIDKETDDGFQATHVLLPRRVRLSVMHPTFVGLQPVAVRMMREACILEALRHPGVPRIYEVGVLADNRVQRPWIASELVEGETLLGRRLPVGELLSTLRHVAEILAHTHARGVSHRGVRPDAIVRGDGSRGFPICLVNWGEARVPDATEDKDRAYADDIFALGLVADLVLPLRAAAPAKLGALIDDMLAPNPMSRPCASEVAARATSILDEIELVPDDDVDVVEERVVLVEIAPVGIPTPRPGKLRWTPALGVAQTPPPVPATIGRLKPRS